jgi:hypothetical protein
MGSSCTRHTVRSEPAIAELQGFGGHPGDSRETSSSVWGAMFVKLMMAVTAMLVPSTQDVPRAGLSLTGFSHSDTGSQTRPALDGTHKNSREIISVHQSRAGLEAEIHDDGRGATVLTPGNGLTGMRERVQALGGTVCLDGTRGFRVTITVPHRSTASPSRQPDAVT